MIWLISLNEMPETLHCSKQEYQELASECCSHNMVKWRMKSWTLINLDLSTQPQCVTGLVLPVETCYTSITGQWINVNIIIKLHVNNVHVSQPENIHMYKMYFIVLQIMTFHN